MRDFGNKNKLYKSSVIRKFCTIVILSVFYTIAIYLLRIDIENFGRGSARYCNKTAGIHLS